MSSRGKSSQFRPKKPKTLKSLKKREPAVIEDVKTALFIRGASVNQLVTNLMKDLFMLKKPHATNLNRKQSNLIFPFSDSSIIESFSYRYNASLFVLGTHSKKRPNNLVIGRLFDYQILDMFEFCVTDYSSINDIKAHKLLNSIGSKPAFVLFGEAFVKDEVYKTIANLFVDFFRGTVVKSIGHANLDHVITMGVVDDVIQFSHYSIQTLNQGSEVKLAEIGPSMKLKLRRTHIAADDLRKQTLEIPRALLTKKIKNQKRDSFNSKVASIYVPPSDLHKVTTNKSRVFKKRLSMHSADSTQKKFKN